MPRFIGLSMWKILEMGLRKGGPGASFRYLECSDATWSRLYPVQCAGVELAQVEGSGPWSSMKSVC